MDLHILRNGRCNASSRWNFAGVADVFAEVFKQPKFLKQSPRIIRNFHGDVKKKCRSPVTHIFKSQRSLREALPKRRRIGKFPVKIFQCTFASFSHHSYIDRTNRRLIYFAHDEYVTRVYNKSVFEDSAVNRRSRVLRRKTPSLLNRTHTSFMRYTNKLMKHVSSCSLHCDLTRKSAIAKLLFSRWLF